MVGRGETGTEKEKEDEKDRESDRDRDRDRAMRRQSKSNRTKKMDCFPVSVSNLCHDFLSLSKISVSISP